MKLNILIVEDKDLDYKYNCESCIEIAEEFGYNVDNINFQRTKTVEHTRTVISDANFQFDVVIFDIGLGGAMLPVEQIGEFFNFDLLNESKIIIHTGDDRYWKDSNKILTSIANGVRGIARKGDDGLFSLELHFKRALTEIKNETIWSNIGRFSPLWKRSLFRNETLWKELKRGKKTEKIFMLVDVSYSTDFIIAQRTSHVDDSHTLELFRSFANSASEIIEKDEYKGIVERFSGDEFLAYFNLEEDKELSCKNVINAAIEISEIFNNIYVNLVNKYKYVSVSKDAVEIIPSLRILIHCGEVIWLFQGADSRPQLSIMTGNVARLYRAFTHRLESGIRVIQPNEICISNDVFLHIENDSNLNFENHSVLDLRNFKKFPLYKLKK